MSDTRVPYKPYIVGGASTSFLVPSGTPAQTFPDAVAGLVGGGASYTGWWGMRAYSAAKAAAQANAIQLQSINTTLTANIRLTTTGVLNTADIATLDASLGLVASSIYDQVGSIDWGTAAAISSRPLFHQDYYGPNQHALEWRSNLIFINITNFPNTANNYIWTSYLKFVTGQTNTVIWGSNTTLPFYAAVDATKIYLNQDTAFSQPSITAGTIDIPKAVLWHFNGTTDCAINWNGSDNPLGTTVGTNAITDNAAGLGSFSGATNGWNQGFWSEGGYMTNTAVVANSINATTRTAITTEMNNFYT